jgi:hypothetical protein
MIEFLKFVSRAVFFKIPFGNRMFPSSVVEQWGTYSAGSVRKALPQSLDDGQVQKLSNPNCRTPSLESYRIEGKISV